MEAPPAPPEAEKPTRLSNDAEALIKAEKGNEESTEEKKGTNGFLVRRAAESIAALF